MIGGIYALLSAITFGLNNASLRRGVLTGSVLQALSITVPIGVPVFVAVVLISGDSLNLLYLPVPALLWFSLAGVLHFVIGRYSNYRSTKAIGANLSGAWRQSNLIISLVLAVILLGESFTPLKVLGILCILGGAMLTSKAAFKSKPGKHKPIQNEVNTDRKAIIFEPSYFEGYLFATLAAIAYGTSPVLVKFGLDNLAPGQSVIGGLISYLAASLMIALVLLLPGNWQHVRQISTQSAKWFSMAALLVGVSQIFRYLALSLAPVSVVTPIQSTSVVFRVLFGWFINRQHEAFGIWVIVGVLISMIGVLALTLSVDGLLEMLPLSDSIKGLASYQWP